MRKRVGSFVGCFSRWGVFPWKGHRERADAVALSPDGGTVVTTGRDQRVLIWNTDDGTIRAEAKGHEHYVVAAAISPDGFRLATGSWDKTVRVWDLRTGEAIGQPFVGHKESVYAVRMVARWNSRDFRRKRRDTAVLGRGHGRVARTGIAQSRTDPLFGAIRRRKPSGCGLRRRARRVVGLVGGGSAAGIRGTSRPGVVGLVRRGGKTVGHRRGRSVGCITLRIAPGRRRTSVGFGDGERACHAVGTYEPVGAVLFSRDGQRIFTAGLDGDNAADRVLKVWNGARYNEIATFLSEAGTLRGLALHADGLRLFAPGRMEH